MSRLQWGILGTGNIAQQFAAGVNASRRGRVVAVGSRSSEMAATFAREFGIESSHGSYAAMLADRGVHAVYNSLPNSLHHELTIKSLRAGKHVLCEKPFALNAHESQEMFDAAQRAGGVLVEAFMYRSHPQTRAVLQEVKNGTLGRLRLIRTSFCYRTTRIDGNIRFVRELGGGALMDVGCYCVDFARLVTGAEPTMIHATAQMHPRGVDEIVAGTLQFPGGITASFTCGMSVQADNTAYICGDERFIEIPVPWKPPVEGAHYVVARGKPPRQDAGKPQPVGPLRQSHSVDAGMDLYGLEADDFAATVLDGAAPAVTKEQTMGNMRVLDEMRRQIGLSFAD